MEVVTNHFLRNLTVGFDNLGEAWLHPYGGNFHAAIDPLWKELKPFYMKLHAWVRMVLRGQFEDIMPPDGTIPADLFGKDSSVNTLVYVPTFVPSFVLVAAAL